MWGRARPATPHPAEAMRRPLPFLAVKLVGRNRLEQELIAFRRTCCAEGLVPALPWHTLQRYDQAIFFDTRSTVSPNRHCSMMGLGMRMPRELPIRTSSVFIVTTFPNTYLGIF